MAHALSELRIEYRYDLRGSRPQVREYTRSGEWHDLDDRRQASIVEAIASQFTWERSDGKTVPLRFGRDAWDTAFNALLHENQVDPFRLWLTTVAQDALADGGAPSPLLHSCLAECFELDPDTDPCLAAWAATYLTVGAIQRAVCPGAKLDEIPVFVGPQGCGKSTFLRELLPPEHQSEWFSDNLHLQAPDKERVEALQGAVIVEISEMAGSNRAEIEGTKAFLSRKVDRVRLAYRRNPEKLPRRCVIAGTTNSETSLPNDPSGLRRFVPIKILGGSACRVIAFTAEHREALWREALHLYFAGIVTDARLPDELKDTAATAAEAHRRNDLVVEDALADWIAGRERAAEFGGTAGPFTIREAMKGCGVSELRADDPHLARRYATALTAMGYTMKRRTHSGRQARLWAENW